MSCSYYVFYRGKPEDSENFLDYYRKQHASILKTYPGIRSCLLHRPVDWSDPVTVQPENDIYLIAELIFNSLEDLNFALASEERQNSRRDFEHFPLFKGNINHQAMITEELF